MMLDAQIVVSMRRIFRYVWLAGLVLSACAPPTLAGTELGATDAPDFTSSKMSFTPCSVQSSRTRSR